MLTAISEDQIANLLIKQLSAIFFVDDAEKILNRISTQRSTFTL